MVKAYSNYVSGTRTNKGTRPGGNGAMSRGDGSGRVGHVTVLSCHCTPVFLSPAPKVGDYVMCRKHKDSARVEHVDTEHRARCKNCTYSRSFGRAAHEASKAARNHASSKEA